MQNIKTKSNTKLGIETKTEVLTLWGDKRSLCIFQKSTGDTWLNFSTVALLNPASKLSPVSNWWILPCPVTTLARGWSGPPLVLERLLFKCEIHSFPPFSSTVLLGEVKKKEKKPQGAGGPWRNSKYSQPRKGEPCKWLTVTKRHDVSLPPVRVCWNTGDALPSLRVESPHKGGPFSARAHHCAGAGRPLRSQLTGPSNHALCTVRRQRQVRRGTSLCGTIHLPLFQHSTADKGRKVTSGKLRGYLGKEMSSSPKSSIRRASERKNTHITISKKNSPPSTLHYKAGQKQWHYVTGNCF